MTTAVVRAGTTKLGYRPELDGLRALAIVGVLLGHTGWWWAYGGCLGVDLFFVLSGFLITTLLLEEHGHGGVRLGAFYRRRMARLLPGLLVVVAASAVWAVTMADPQTRGVTLSLIPAVLLYVGNWGAIAQDGQSGAFGAMWSLGVEEQFYVVWPLALGLLVRFARRKVALVLAGGSLIVCTLIRAAVWDAAQPWMMFRTDAVADLLLVGCAAAMWRGSIPRQVAWVAALCMCALAGPIPFDGWALRAFRPALFGVATAVVLLRVVQSPPRWLAASPLVAVGKASYSLYLWHLLVYGMAQAVGWSRPAAIAATGLVAAVSYLWIELPARAALSLRRDGGGQVAVFRHGGADEVERNDVRPHLDIARSGA